MGNSLSRRNTESDRDQLQFVTPRGNLPLKIADQAVRQAPPPGTRTRSGYPQVYRNEEGPVDATRQNFEDWERRDTSQLNEYVVLPTGSTAHFKYDKKSKSHKQASRPIAPKDRARVVNHPINNPEYMRTITSQNQNRVIGANFHPEDEPRGFERAALRPLDTNGRNHVRRERYREAVRHATHPPPFQHREDPTPWP